MQKLRRRDLIGGVAKARRRTKATSRGQKAWKAELAKGRRRAQQLGRHKVSPLFQVERKAAIRSNR